MSHIKRLAESQLVDPLWERQPGEGPVSYGYFRAYRDLGVRRSQTRVAEMFEVSADLINKTATAKRWGDRAAAFDAWLDTRALGAGESTARESAAHVQRRIAELIEEEWVIAKAARDRVLEIIQDSTAGDPKNALRDAAALLREAGRMGRLSVGLHTEGGKPAAPSDAAKDSDIDAFLGWLGSGGAQEGEAPEGAAPMAGSTDTTEEAKG